MPERLPYIASCQLLISQQLLDGDEVPPLPERPPRYDDETLGVGFFRTQLADTKLDGLTLPRTFFGRSEIRSVSFRDTDLSESTANWNDFTEVDFSSADLSRADLRHATFTDCTFADADFTGAKLARESESLLSLSPTQRSVIEWHPDLGDEPGGG